MHRIALAAFAFAPLSGCANPCSGPTQIAGIVYSGFSTVRTFGSASDSEEEIGEFPVYETPANGAHTWEFRWGGANTGPLVMVVDGQEFDGTGSWDLVDCGTFTVDVPEQPYIDDEGNVHEFTTSGLFMAFGPRLEGSLYWQESWSIVDEGSQGTFVATDLQIRGYNRATTP